MLSMNFTRQEIPDILLIEQVRFEDDRGYFTETFKESVFYNEGLAASFVQDNLSRSRKGVVRGLHYQAPPSAQGKLVQVARGAVLDVAVDIRYGSPWFGRHVATELGADDGLMLWVPAGFAHGFRALEDDTDVMYKVTAEWDPERERGIRFDDPALCIDWGIASDELLVSAKDEQLPLLADLERDFES